MGDRNYAFNADVVSMPIAGVDRIMCVILADVSGSMSKNGKIDQLNQGLRDYINDIKEDAKARQSVETTIITFGSRVEEVITCAEIDKLERDLKPLDASGLTCMNEAMNIALHRIEERKQFFRDNGINYFRPWLFLLSDGLATDSELAEKTSKSMLDAIMGKHVVFYPLMVGNDKEAEMGTVELTKYVPAGAAVLRISEKNFGEMFKWLSATAIKTTHSDPALTPQGDVADLPETVTLAGVDKETGMFILNPPRQ